MHVHGYYIKILVAIINVYQLFYTNLMTLAPPKADALAFKHLTFVQKPDAAATTMTAIFIERFEKPGAKYIAVPSSRTAGRDFERIWTWIYACDRKFYVIALSLL